MKCDSSTICDSIKLSMTRKYFPRRQNIELNPNDTCPDLNVAPKNSTKWTNLSRECSKSDSVCLEATIEVVTSFNGLKDSFKLEEPSSMKSKGILRACASRRFLLNLTDETYEVRAEGVSDTLRTVLLADSRNPNYSTKDKYAIMEIISHYFYIDHGTPDAVRCYEDNCNLSMRSKKSGASNLHSNYYLNGFTIMPIFSLILLNGYFGY